MPIKLVLGVLTLALCACGGSPSESNAEVVSHRLPQWSVSSQILHKNGEPFFMRGAYHVTHFPEHKERRRRDLELLAAAGFNVIHTPIDLSDRDILDQAAALGLYVIAEFNADPEAVVQSFAEHPALMAWGSFDDVDAERFPGVARHSPERVRQRNSELRQKSPRILTYISGGFPKRLGRYAGLADLIGVQAYPVPVEPLRTVIEAYSGPLGQAIGAAPDALLANVQLFGWHGRERWPTGAELRNMTYQSLVGGVRGLLFYTYFDEVTDVGSQPEIWGETRRLLDDLGKHAPLFAAGSHCRWQVDQPEVFAAQWRLAEQELSIVVNTSAKAIRAVRGKGCRADSPDWQMLATDLPPLGVREQ